MGRELFPKPSCISSLRCGCRGALGASVTPEVFVFDKQRKIVYMGAFDDSMDKPNENYFSAAIDAALVGKSVKTGETKARGCNIRYEKSAKTASAR